MFTHVFTHLNLYPFRKSRLCQENLDLPKKPLAILSDRSRYVIKIIGMNNAIEHVFPMDYVSNGGQVAKTL